MDNVSKSKSVIEQYMEVKAEFNALSKAGKIISIVAF